MRRVPIDVAGLALFVIGGAAQASHNWGGIDVCTVYRETAPPGIDPATLPEPRGRGARLLQQYCVQCHQLTGPGRHTAEEWPAVLERMRMLMDVSRRFRGLMGSIRMPDANELGALGEYLAEHALQPLRGTPRGFGAQAFASACSGCHTLPDPRRYRAAQWTAVVGQMRDKAGAMGRAELTDSLASAEVLAFLQRNAADRLPGDPHGNAVVAPVSSGAVDGSARQPGLERLVWLTPFFAAIGLGLWRWWARRAS